MGNTYLAFAKRVRESILGAPLSLCISRCQDGCSSSDFFHVAVCLNRSWTGSWFAWCQSAVKTICTVKSSACRGFRKAKVLWH